VLLEFYTLALLEEPLDTSVVGMDTLAFVAEDTSAAVVADTSVVVAETVQEDMVMGPVVGIQAVDNTEADIQAVVVAAVVVGCQIYVRTSLDYSFGKFLIASDGPGWIRPRLNPIDNIKRHDA
jgi:hypothetical protein